MLDVCLEMKGILKIGMKCGKLVADARF